MGRKHHADRSLKLPQCFQPRTGSIWCRWMCFALQSRRQGWLWLRRQQSIDMLPSTSTKMLFSWTASLAVAAFSGFGVGFYVASRLEAPNVENTPNAGRAPNNSDSEDDTNDLEDVAKVKAGILEPCKMARTLHLTCARSSNHFCRSSW